MLTKLAPFWRQKPHFVCGRWPWAEAVALASRPTLFLAPNAARKARTLSPTRVCVCERVYVCSDSFERTQVQRDCATRKWITQERCERVACSLCSGLNSRSSRNRDTLSSVDLSGHYPISFIAANTAEEDLSLITLSCRVYYATTHSVRQWEYNPFLDVKRTNERTKMTVSEIVLARRPWSASRMVIINEDIDQ